MHQSDAVGNERFGRWRVRRRARGAKESLGRREELRGADYGVLLGEQCWQCGGGLEAQKRAWGIEGSSKAQIMEFCWGGAVLV
ncbi:hypothetical protein VNO80_13472 [Phaseolus coccineus]|uniref:Uncharacterized protein n=1 Tax=Phaseolus coccineus TaxID=3886 RepID=A0AAN9RA07_PHACN